MLTKLPSFTSSNQRAELRLHYNKAGILC